MIVVIFFSALALLLTYLSKYNGFRYGFEAAIIILICILGVRYNYGNDYPSYYRIFQEINSYGTLSEAINSIEIENGWILLNRFFSSFGFSSLVFFLTLFQFGSFYYLVKKYVDRRRRWIAMFFYLFSSGLMLTMISMMRQCFAMCILVYAVASIIDKKYIKSVFLIIVAAQFHQSAYIMLLLPFVPLLQKLNKRMYVVIFISLFIVFFLSQTLLGDQIGAIVNTYFLKYSYYLEKGNGVELGSGIGFILNIVVFICILLYDPHDNSTNSIFMKLMAMSFLFIPLSFVIQSIGRVGDYFRFLGIIGLVPMTIMSTKKVTLLVVMGAYIFVTLYGYITFFYDPVWTDAYLEYHTIFNQ